ncbi:DMT family transporter [Vibrio ostreicida]|uniref:DMT family transporter n=1 Tax=Vibrio ostreicida TaxID=526588 RepID=UPI0009703A1D|nr:DMT family transporter [Vibrio ostreicida]
MDTSPTSVVTERKFGLSSFQIGVVLALLGTVLFSIKPIMVKLAYQYGGNVESIMSLRAITSLPFYLVILLLLCQKTENRQLVKTHGLKAIAIGVLGYYGASYLDIVALEFISAQLERLLLFLFPTFVVLITWVAFGKRPTLMTALATLMGYLGISVVFVQDMQSFGDAVWFGAGLAVASAFVFAVYLVLSKGLITQMGSKLFNSLGMMSAGVAILVHALAVDLDPTNWSWQLIAIGTFMGFFCTVLPSYIVAAAMARLTPTELSLSNNIGPLVTAILAVVILGELFTIWHAIGMALVTGSIVLVNRNKQAE